MSDYEIVVSEEFLGGEPRIEDTRIGVSHVVQYYEKGWNVDKISRELKIEPLQVIKALEYYYKNPQEIRQLIRNRKSKEASINEEGLQAEKA